jgi:hypothetical protein
MADGVHAPVWVAAVLPEEIVRQRQLGWPDMHPEDFCHRCGRRNPVWYTSPTVWNAVTEARRRETGRDSVLCPSCFVELHEQQFGVQQGFLWGLSLDDMRGQP